MRNYFEEEHSIHLTRLVVFAVDEDGEEKPLFIKAISNSAGEDIILGEGEELHISIVLGCHNRDEGGDEEINGELDVFGGN